MEDFSAPIADLEPDGKRLPILVRQYVKLGGELLAFSVDPQFGNTLDEFVMLDLTETGPEILARYMGKEQTRNFFAWHRSPRPRPPRSTLAGGRAFMPTAKDILNTLSERMQASAHVRNVSAIRLQPAIGPSSRSRVSATGWAQAAAATTNARVAGAEAGLAHNRLESSRSHPQVRGLCRFHGVRRLAIASAMGFLFGVVLGRRRKRE